MSKQNKILIILGVILILIFILILSSFTTIPTGYVGIKTRFGEVQESVVNEGLNLKLPFIEKIVKIDCRTQLFENENLFETSTKDLQIVRDLSIAVNYNVNKDTANKLYQQVGEDYKNIIISPAIQESVKAAFSQFTAEELTTNRSEVSKLIKEDLSNRLITNGINVLEVSIKDFNFSEQYNKAVEEKAIAQQNVEKAKAELEKAQVENQKKIEDATAEAETMKIQNEQITENYLKLKEIEIQKAMIDKWDGHTPTTVMGSDVSSILNLNK